MSKKLLFILSILLLTACTTKSVDDTLTNNLNRKNLLAPESAGQKQDEGNLKLDDSVQMDKNGQPVETPSEAAEESDEPMDKQTSWDTPPTMEINTAKSYTAAMTTDKGEILIELYDDMVPVTVNNFVFLSRQGFYDNVIFHRTIDGFMIQGGDPTGTGTGGPGYRFEDEPFEGKYEAGTLAMANAGPNTNGSQFFIMHKDYPLPPNYTIFGKVSQGMDVVDAIATAPTKPGGEGSSPVTPVKITKIIIREE